MNNIRKILQNSGLQQIFMAFILALGASLLIIDPVSPTPNIEAGDIAQRDIQAPPQGRLEGRRDLAVRCQIRRWPSDGDRARYMSVPSIP